MFRICLSIVMLLLELKLSQSACTVTLSQPPWPMTYLLVPENSTTIIKCAYEGVPEPYFEVVIANTSYNDIEFDDARGQREILHNHGLYELSDSPLAAIEINNTNVNNGTTIKCTYVGKSRPDQTELLVYEPTAIVLDIVDVDARVVNISWSGLSVVNLINVVQDSTLTITYGSNWKIVINTTEHHYSFTAPEGAPPCEVYNFSVTATYVGATYLGACCSVPSAVVSRVLPSLPNIKRLKSSLKHSLTNISGELKLNVSFESGLICEEYPVLNYTLEVEDLSPKVVTHSRVQFHIIVIGNLSENREYSFRILAANNIGYAYSNSRKFYTTQVQLVTASFDENNNVTVVKCHFIPGSNSQGCVVILVGESENTTVNLTRSRYGVDTVAVEMINVTCPQINYTRVIGYDIESYYNKSIGIVAVEGELLLTLNYSTICPPTNNEMESSHSQSLLVIIIAVTVTFLVIIMVMSLITLFLRVRSKSGAGVFRSSLKSGIPNLQCSSQPKQDHKEQLEGEDSQKTIPLYDLPEKSCNEHFYHVLENAKKAIPPDPDAPELPPPFKPEPSPPPVYHDILDLSGGKGHTAVQNEYYTVST